MVTFNALIYILIAAITGFMVGSIWYAPYGFGKLWMKYKGVKPKDIKGANIAMLYGFITHVVMAYFLYLVVMAFGVTSLVGGISIGFYLGIGFVATSMFMDYVYEPNKKDKNAKLFLLNVSHRLVTLAIMGGVIGIIV